MSNHGKVNKPPLGSRPVTTSEEINLTNKSGYKPILAGVLVTLPAVIIRLGNISIHTPVVAVLIFGSAIVGSAFLLSWGAEVAELDISRGLAIAVLALIAVLPEYAVDLVFALHGGNDFAKYGASCKPPGSEIESNCSLALANMTGSNRLLIGIGWSLVVFVAYFAWKRRGVRKTEVTLPRSHSIEVAFLCIAAFVGLTISAWNQISLIYSVLLIAIFIGYTIRISKSDAEAPELVGPAAWIATFSVNRRRSTVVLMFAFSGFVILLCAHPFADSIVHAGKQLNISEFFLVQWVAPLATEAPELLIASLFAWRLRAENGLSTLISSKVNQWTLLVGTLPIAFALAAGQMHGLPIDSIQKEELFLTSAQTIFAIAVIVSLSLSMWEAIGLLGLFSAQFILAAFPNILNGFGHHINADDFESHVRISVSIVYLAIATVLLYRQRKQAVRVIRDGLITPVSEIH
jgi:cation:H+ antiporter